MAAVAAFPYVDITSSQLQRGVRLYPFDGLGGRLLEEKWNDFNQSTDQEHQQNQNNH
jgi:hypothetical protein